MTVTTLPIAGLSSRHWQAWEKLRAGNSLLRSPHFAPEFARQLGAVRRGIEVIVVERSGSVEGLLPFHRRWDGCGESPAASFSDLEGWVTVPEARFDLPEILRHAGLAALRFRRALADQTMWQDHVVQTDVNPFLDLRDGFEVFRARCRSVSDELQDVLRKRRKLEREHGPVTFEPACRDTVLLRLLLSWKSEQLRRRRRFNPIRAPWQFALLDNLLKLEDSDFGGWLSVLRTPSDIVAMAYSVRSQGTLAGWITAYNESYRKYSPGLMLLTELARAAPELGIDRIEMGAGRENYKRSFAIGTVETVEGVATSNVVRKHLETGWLHARRWLREARVLEPARQWWQWTRSAMRGPGREWDRRGKAAALPPPAAWDASYAEEAR